MVCPQCSAEYRPGFTRCSDCNLELVEEPPPQDPRELESDSEGRPELAPIRVFLTWFLPMCIFLLFVFGACARPRLLQNLRFVISLASFALAGVFGAVWMISQAVRYERRVGKYVLIAVVPFMFVWYAIVRVPLRKAVEDKPDLMR